MTFEQSPIIVGLSSRVAGARGNAAMWDALLHGKCNIREIDPKFFKTFHYYDPHRPRRGKTYSNMAGQIDQIDQFDAGFFNISPREAEQIDPQQRLMLQSVWEAIEDAGLRAESLAGPRTGVFIGSSIVENLSLSYTDPERGDSSQALGNTLAIIANRVSAQFDFRGPSMVLDTACSSSLYALHLGAESLRRGELDSVIVGGVNLSRTPGGYITFAQARMISPSGTCHAFDAKADGYVRAEACVSVLLQRPEIAEKMQARRRARVLASAINTDGASSMITVPSASQQSELLKTVLTQSEIDPDDLSFFEAHGTGTAVGDPIEAYSLGSSLGQLRRDPLPIGSAKTNFGHAEPAAGLVGLAKVLLAFEHQTIPASLNFQTPNPAIAFDELNLQVLTKPRAFDPDRPMIAGVNSFGFGGTNASAILQAERTAPGPRQVLGPAKPWLLLSAASQTALETLARKWAQHLRKFEPALWPSLLAAQAQSTDFGFRMALPSTADLPQRLETAAASLREADVESKGPTTEAAQTLFGRAALNRPQNLFVFSGNGTQTTAMGRREYQGDPRFKKHFDRVAEAFIRHGGPDLYKALFDDNIAPKLLDPALSTPYLFGFQIAMARSLVDYGLTAEAVVGHSAGEIAALHFAGCYDLDTAAQVVLARAALVQGLRGQGSMAVIAASREDVESILRGFGEPNLVIAAVNSPRSVTIAGPAQAIERLRAVRLRNRRLALFPLKLDIPYHSPALDAVKDAFMARFDNLTFSPQTLEVFSPVTGKVLRQGGCNRDYLWKNMRQNVLFSDAITAACAKSPTCAIEISPTSSFSTNMHDLAQIEGLPIHYVFPLEKTTKVADQLEECDFSTRVARAWVRAARVDATRLSGAILGPKPDVPSYPWDERSYHAPISPNGIDAWGEKSLPRLVGLNLERSSYTWLADVTPTSPAWVKHHRIGETIVLPATALIEMMLNAAEVIWPNQLPQLHDFTIFAPVVLSEEGQRLRTFFDPTTGKVTIHQRARLELNDWILCAQAVMRPQKADTEAKNATPRQGPAHLRPPVPKNATQTDGPALYKKLATDGLLYGAEFRRVTHAFSAKNGDIWADIVDKPAPDMLLDPIGFDGCLHALDLLMSRKSTQKILGDTDGVVMVPWAFESLRMYQPHGSVAHARFRIRRQRSRSFCVEATLFDAQNRVLVEITGLDFSAMAVGRQPPRPRQRIRRRFVRLMTPITSPTAKDDRFANLQSGCGFQLEAPASLPLDQTFDHIKYGLKRGDDQAFAALLPAQPQLAHDLRSLSLHMRAEEPRYAFRHSEGQKTLWEAARKILDHSLRTWPQRQRLNILISGMVDPATLRHILAAAEGRIDQIWLSLGEGQPIDPLRESLPQDLQKYLRQTIEAGSVDLLLDLDFVPTKQTVLNETGLGLRLTLPHLSGWRPMVGRRAIYTSPNTGMAVLVEGCRGTRHTKARMKQKQLALVREKNLFQEPAPYDTTEPDHELPESMAALVQPASSDYRMFYRNIPDDVPLTATLISLLHDIARHSAPNAIPLVIVLTFERASPQSYAICAAMRALVHNLRNESGSSAFGAICVFDPVDKPQMWLALIEQSLFNGHVIWQNGQSLTTRLESDDTPAIQQGRHMEIVNPLAGGFSSLRWKRAALPVIKPDHILIEVAASGLNYRDVMAVRNLLPERSLDLGATKAALGLECVGRIRAVGAGVTQLSVDQTVVAFAAPAFANHVLAHASAVMPVTGEVDTHALYSNATTPVAFLTAWHSLVSIARLGPKDRVLIHGAAGAVGLAAIQIAKLKGAEVFATAGTHEKRLIAKAYGADHCFDSRSLAFADQISSLTKGAGVSCVVNTLAGDAMRRSLELLAPFGCFIELGKRDYLEGTQINLAPFLHNLRYYGVDMDQYVARYPEDVAGYMRDISACLANGDLRPLPYTLYAGRDVAQGFQEMFAGHHIGKILIAPPQPSNAKTLSGASADLVGTWVLIGGNSSLGYKVANALRAAGVEKVVALSRSGISTATHMEPQLLSALQHMAVDASDPSALSDALRRINRTGPKIAGIVHMAMVLRDRTLQDLDKFEVEQVIRAKVSVAQSLHQVITDLNIKPFLVFFSSIAAAIGNTGQAAYSAANAATEALADQWRDAGQRILSIGWAPIHDAGYIPRDSILRTKIERQNVISTISADDVTSELITAISHYRLKTTPKTYTFAAIDWQGLPTLLPNALSPEFQNLITEPQSLAARGTALVEELITLPWSAALQRVETEMVSIFTSIMRMAAKDFDLTKPFMNQGLDSLMALELRLEIERRFGPVPTSFTFTPDMTGTKLAVGLLKKIRSNDPESAIDHG